MHVVCGACPTQLNRQLSPLVLTKFYRLISRDQITMRSRQKLYKRGQRPLLESIAAWQVSW